LLQADFLDIFSTHTAFLFCPICFSGHPIACSLVKAYPEMIPFSEYLVAFYSELRRPALSIFLPSRT
jgi:hypothetical protein